MSKLYLSIFVCMGIAMFGFWIYSDAQMISHAPVVLNVHAEKRLGENVMDITFDLEDEDGDLVEIILIASSNAGKSFEITPRTITGDFGRNIEPGKGKKISWDAGKDIPGADCKSLMVRLIANDSVRLVTTSSAPPAPFADSIPLAKASRDLEQMILIPAGEFEMGSSEGSSDERPVHTVYLDEFSIDAYEVTNAQYKRFTDATRRDTPLYWRFAQYSSPDQPVIGVSWEDAKAYAEWAGKRLPTEAEWEKAARGGLIGKKYVWGDGSIPPRGSGNFADETAKKAFAKWTVISGYNDSYAYTAPVGSFAPNGYGLYDMAGNVWEWCSDFYDPSYYSKSSKQNPTGPRTGTDHILRGGSWFANNDYLRVANRYDYSSSYTVSSASNIGFRCAKSR